MTRLAVGFGRGFPRIWLLPIGWLTVLLGIAASGRLSRSIVADLIAWWPMWLAVTLAAVFLRERKVDQFRVAGIVPLVAFLFVLLFTWGHLVGWTIMPSAAQRLVGPELAGYTDANLQAEIDGRIEVQGGGEFLYRVEPLKQGGGIGIPTAAEEVLDSSVSVMLQAPDDPGLYSFAGWRLILADEPRWSLTLDGAIDADLTSLTIDALSIDGSGQVALARVDDETVVTIGGSFLVTVPPDTAARVVGEASVPATWTIDSRGAASPVLGAGWVFQVRPGATLRVAERP